MKIIIILAVAIWLVCDLFRLFIALAVNADCRANAIKTRVLWGVLAYVFPLSAVLYVIVKDALEKTAPKFCPVCRQASPSNAYACLHCGNSQLQYYQVSNAAQYKKQAKQWVVAAVCLWILSIVISVAFSVKVISYAVHQDNYSANPFVDDFSDFSDDFREFKEFGDFSDNFDFKKDLPPQEQPVPEQPENPLDNFGK